MSIEEKAQKVLVKLKNLFPSPQIALTYETPWQLFVAVVLSARNTDKKVNEVTHILFKKYKTMQDYRKAEVSELEKNIGKLGLFRQKAKWIKEAAQIIDREHNGKIPDSMEELLKLPGVGRKTANVLLGILYGKTEGIVVDTHVMRLSCLFGLSTHRNPAKIEQDLMRIVPQNEWISFPLRLILYGRTYCPAHCKHTTCPLRMYIS